MLELQFWYCLGFSSWAIARIAYVSLIDNVINSHGYDNTQLLVKALADRLTLIPNTDVESELNSCDVIHVSSIVTI